MSFKVKGQTKNREIKAIERTSLPLARGQKENSIQVERVFQSEALFLVLKKRKRKGGGFVVLEPFIIEG